MPVEKSSSSRNGVLAIASGTGAASAVALLGSPVIARLYAPQEFGEFASITAIAFVLTPLISLRLELAVPLADKDDEARDLVIFASVIACAFGAVGALSLLVAKAAWGLDVLSGALWMVPLAAASMAVYQVLNSLAIRAGRFRSIAARNLVVGCGTLLLQLGFGAVGLGVAGLVVGWSAGQVLGAVALLPSSGLLRRRNGPKPFASSVRRLLRRFSRIPVLFAPAGVINVLGLQVPVLLLLHYYGSAAAGQFGMTQRVLSIPVALIGLAVSQVFLSHLARSRRSGFDSAELFRSTSRKLFIFGAAIGALLLLLGRPAFELVLGDQWSVGGRMAQVMSIALLFQLVASPLSQTLVVYERSIAQLTWDIGRLALVVGSFAVAAQLGASAVQAVTAFALAIACAYAVSWWLSWVTVRTAERGAQERTRDSP